MLFSGSDYFLEFSCNIGQLNAAGVDMITLDDRGLIKNFEVVMRPYKSVGELRKAMTLLTSKDPFFSGSVNKVK